MRNTSFFRPLFFASLLTLLFALPLLAQWEPERRLTFDPAPSLVAFNAAWAVAASGDTVHIAFQDGRDRPSGPEIYYKRSTDGGTTWGPDTRICHGALTSWEPSVAVSGSKVHVVWSDGREGNYNYEIYYARNLTGNLGITEKTDNRYQISDVRLKIKPNPFANYTTVPGHEQKNFALYDITGRKAGAYRGDRIGEGLAAGIYFLKTEGQAGKPLRVVKLR